MALPDRNESLAQDAQEGDGTGDGNFEGYFDKVAAAPDEIPDEYPVQIAGSTVEELRVRCTTGMLMCLDREQRVVFILGALFNVDHAVGGEALGLTPGNFRVCIGPVRIFISG